jgi:drug/metabolite transporter (DMT)-like permease
MYVGRYGARSLMTFIIWIGTAYMLPWLPSLIGQIRVADPRATMSIIYLGMVPTALAYVTWLYVLSRLPASRAATWLYLLPALAFIIAWVWLGERPHVLSIVGGALAIVGIALVNTRGGDRTREEELSVIEPEILIETAATLTPGAGSNESVRPAR